VTWRAFLLEGFDVEEADLVVHVNFLYSNGYVLCALLVDGNGIVLLLNFNKKNMLCTSFLRKGRAFSLLYKKTTWS
jgi:hypothetical protein